MEVNNSRVVYVDTHGVRIELTGEPDADALYAALQFLRGLWLQQQTKENQPC